MLHVVGQAHDQQHVALGEPQIAALRKLVLFAHQPLGPVRPDHRDAVKIGDARARQGPADQARIGGDDHLAHGDVDGGFARATADPVDHPAGRRIPAQSGHRLLDRLMRAGHAQAMLRAQQARRHIVELDPGGQARFEFGQLLAIEDRILGHAQPRFEQALRVDGLDPVIAQHTRHHDPHEWQGHQRGDQHDRGEMEHAHFGHAEIDGDRHDENIGGRADRGRHPAHQRRGVERDQRLRSRHRPAHCELHEDRHQKNQHRCVVDAHRQQESHHQREQQAKLQVDLEQSLEEPRGRVERTGHHQPAAHDHQGADSDQRVMAEAGEGEAEPVDRLGFGQREEIEADRDHRDRHQRDDLDRHASARESDEHGEGDAHRRYCMVGRNPDHPAQEIPVYPVMCKALVWYPWPDSNRHFKETRF